MKKNNYLLLHLFLESVLLYKDKVALIIDDEKISYQTLYNDCLSLIQKMKFTRFTRGDRTIIQAGNSYITVVAFWASIMCDCVPCIIDPELKDEALVKLIKTIDPVIIFFDMLSESQIKIIYSFQIDTINSLNDRDINKNPLSFSKSQNTESDLLMIIHTSGSTGEPKGVMLSNRNVLSAIESILDYLKINCDDVILSVLPMHFDYGLYQMILCFSVGAVLVLEKNMLFPAITAQKIVSHKVTVLPCVPLMVQLFYTTQKQYCFDFSSLRIVTNTGENLSYTHIQKIKQTFPTARIFSMYGLTECKRCSYIPPDQLDSKFDSIGISMPNLDMWIQDEQGNPVAPHQEGNLVISGPTVMMGYWRNNTETDKKIRYNPIGKKILITGDRAIMDEDRYFYFRGRHDFIVKYKGIKLDSLDIMKKISCIPYVNRSHIFLETDKQENKILYVCVEVESKNMVNDTLKKEVYSLFPVIQKPDHLYFTDQFPSLSNGKLNKSALEKMAIQVCI